jgi:WD40 repeat protein
MSRSGAVLCVWLAAAPLSAGTDLHGDELPAGAIARFGTVRLRSLCDLLLFSKDGKTLLGVDGGCFLRTWDAASGKLLTTRRLDRRPARSKWSLQTACSLDGRTLVVAEDGKLEMWELPSGKRVEVALPHIRKRMRGLALSDDRRLLLLGELAEVKSLPAGGGFGGFVERWNLLLWDTKTGKERFRLEDQFPLALSPDGKRLASFSETGKIGVKGRIGLRDTTTGKLLWQGPKFNAEEVAFTPDSRSLIVAPGGGQSAWHVWDAATGKPSKQLRPPTVGYAWTFAVAPDGGSVVIPTDTDFILWDLKAGRARHAWPGANQAGRAVFAPDGRSVVTWGTVLRRWDVATGKPLYPDVAGLGHTAPVRRLFFTPDGKRLVSVGEDDTLRVWNRASAKPVTSFTLAGTTPLAWTMTPDGSVLVGLDEHLRVYRWPLKGGRPPPSYLLRGSAELDRRAQSLDARVLPDGKLAVAFWPQLAEYRLRRYSFSFWDLETGGLRHWGGDPGREYRGDRAALSPGGRRVAVSGEVFDTRTGACRPRLKTPGRGEVGGPHVFAPDGRLLAGVASRTEAGVWEAATSRLLAAIPGGETYRGAAFSPHGRRFAFTDGARVVVWDLGRGKAVLERPAPADWPRSRPWIHGGIAFSPDGRAVATGHTDGTILLWAVRPVVPPAGRWTEDTAAGLWKDLGHADPGRAYAAVWWLREFPVEVVRYLADRFRPVETASDAEFRALIRRLDSKRFQEREAASRRLEALGRAAEGILRQALQDKPTAEQKRRIQALLSRLTPSALPQEDALRAVRAVAVVETIDSKAARRLLEEWAKRSRQTELADEAARALARLKVRPVSAE